MDFSEQRQKRAQERHGAFVQAASRTMSELERLKERGEIVPNELEIERERASLRDASDTVIKDAIVGASFVQIKRLPSKYRALVREAIKRDLLRKGA